MGNLEFVRSLCCKVACQMFVMVDYVRKMTVKKSCKYGEHGSFEHLLFLCVCLVFASVEILSYNKGAVTSVSLTLW